MWIQSGYRGTSSAKHQVLSIEGGSVLIAFEFVATLSAALFCGAAVYINLAEHPAWDHALLRLGGRAAWR